MRSEQTIKVLSIGKEMREGFGQERQIFTEHLADSCLAVGNMHHHKSMAGDPYSDHVLPSSSYLIEPYTGDRREVL